MWDALVGHSCRADTFVGHSFGTVLSEHTHIHQSCSFRCLADTCHEITASRQQPETQVPAAQRYPTPPKDHLPANANPNGTAMQLRISRNTAPAQQNHPPLFNMLRFCAMSNESATSGFNPKPPPKASPMARPYRSHSVACERRRTVADMKAPSHEHSSTPGLNALSCFRSQLFRVYTLGFGFRWQAWLGFLDFALALLAWPGLHYLEGWRSQS